jgi:hypothetical protein
MKLTLKQLMPIINKRVVPWDALLLSLDFIHRRGLIYFEYIAASILRVFDQCSNHQCLREGVTPPITPLPSTRQCLRLAIFGVFF